MSLSDLDRYVVHGNISHFSRLLWTRLPAEERATIQRLLIAEEDKLAGEAEMIDVVEGHLADGAQRIARQRAIVAAMERDCDASLPIARNLLATFLETGRLYEDYFKRIRTEIGDDRLRAR